MDHGRSHGFFLQLVSWVTIWSPTDTWITNINMASWRNTNHIPPQLVSGGVGGGREGLSFP